MVGQLVGQRVDLGVERSDDRDARPGRGAVSRLDLLGCAQRVGAQPGCDGVGAGLDVALSAGLA